MSKRYIAVIYEGEKTERILFKNINQFFGKNADILPIGLPAGQNIYMLWKQLEKDEFETDVLEVLREQNVTLAKALNGIERSEVAEIFLWFDYDGHTNNLPEDVNLNDVIENMLTIFNDETDVGKLYVNYPMIESLRDHRLHDEERCYRRCSIKLSECTQYKRMVDDNQNHTFQDFRKLDVELWKSLCKNTLKKNNCIIHGVYEIPVREMFLNSCNQTRLFDKQVEKYITFGMVATISSIPLFLLEYFKEDFWNKMT